MNFGITYTAELEGFRKAVKAWLKANLPVGLKRPADPRQLSHGDWLRFRELGRRLGEKGWLWPTAPREYGGGGLTLDHAIIVAEEMNELDLSLPPYYDPGANMGAPVLLAWGTEEQKQYWLPRMFKGEIAGWQLLTEPGAGSDLYGLTTTAIRDGDEYVVNGTKTFVGGTYEADHFCILVRTDPNGEKHKNLSWFQMPANLPGISRTPLHLMWDDGPGGVSNTVYFNNVRVPAFYLVGGENNGYQVSLSWAEIEHGASGFVRWRNRPFDRLLKCAQKVEPSGQPLSRDPQVQESLVDAFLESEVLRLFKLRNYWMSRARREQSYEGSQERYFWKMAELRMAESMLRILGPYALTNDPAVDMSDGHIETFMRSSVCSLHPGGTEDIQRVVIARRIGIGRTSQEKAGKLAGLVAPT